MQRGEIRTKGIFLCRCQNDFLPVSRRHDLPISLRLFWLNELPVMLKNQMRACVSELQRERSSIVELREVIGRETVAQSILRPFFNSCRFPCAVEKLAIIRWRNAAR